MHTMTNPNEQEDTNQTEAENTNNGNVEQDTNVGDNTPDESDTGTVPEEGHTEPI
jgi:hypothetical protein